MIAHREYWRIVNDSFHSRDYPILDVKKVQQGNWSSSLLPWSADGTPLTAATADFSCPVDLAWGDDGENLEFSDVHASSENAANPSAFRVLIHYDYPTKTWGGWMAFYRKSRADLLFGDIEVDRSRGYSCTPTYTGAKYYCTVGAGKFTRHRIRPR